MASTLVFVSRPSLPRSVFDTLLDGARAASLVPANAEISIRTSSDRLVAKVALDDAQTAAARQAAGQYLDAQVAAGTVAESDVCLAVVDAALTERRRGPDRGEAAAAGHGC